MVRKVIILVLCIAVLSAVPISASAAAYDANIPGDVLPVVEGLLEKNYGFNCNYVLFRDLSSSTYVIIIGEDMSIDNQIVSYSGCDKFILNSDLEVTLVSELEGSIDLSDGSCVYSNMGYYPDLIERSSYYEIATLLLLLACLFCYLLRSIFGFCLRCR